MKYVDLHVHSTASDGTFTPRELVKAAAKAGLSAFALTDHDTVRGVDEAMGATANLNLEVIPGIEISTRYKEKEIHIVGLFVNHHDPALLAGLGNEIDIRNKRNEMLIDKFNEYGFPVTMEEMTSMFPDSVITRAHFASYMVKKGYVKSTLDAFNRYLGEGMPLYVPRDKKSPEEAIKLITSAGGVSVLAHPLLYHLTMGELKELCIMLKDLGLTGIESMYSTYKGFDELSVKALAKEVGLLESGGSDFHGANKPHIRIGSGMGTLRISASYMEQLRMRANPHNRTDN